MALFPNNKFSFGRWWWDGGSGSGGGDDGNENSIISKIKSKQKINVKALFE